MTGDDDGTGRYAAPARSSPGSGSRHARPAEADADTAERFLPATGAERRSGRRRAPDHPGPVRLADGGSDALTDLLSGADADEDRPEDEPGGPPTDGGGGDHDEPGGRAGRAGGGRPRRRRWVWPAVAAVLVLALAAGVFFTRDLFGAFFPADYAGPGSGQVVVQVGEGDSMRAVGQQLVDHDVVASTRAFSTAAEDDPRGRAVAPGFYVLHRQMSARQALAALLDPAARLGRLEVRAGTQLDDTAGAGSTVVPGVLTLLSRATCAPDPAGRPVCRSPEELRQVMATVDPAELGVPEWALADVRRAEPNRRLEGLVVAGSYDVGPGSSAVDALTQVVRASAARIEATGLVAGASATRLSPYQVLVVASVVEKEGVAQDFGRIARVIENRLPIPMRLQMDSTINYPLDHQMLLTTSADRARVGPYNTYLNFGLPPTPIAAPSAAAVDAALAPEPGPWLYFVKCETDGSSCFAVTPAEHDANRRLAQARGVY